ncbi:MAG TPA: hypothetical protein VGB30_10085 [bacterium]
MAGGFLGTSQFDPGNPQSELTSIGGELDAFTVKYLSDGTFAWAIRVGEDDDKWGDNLLGGCLRYSQ